MRIAPKKLEVGYASLQIALVSSGGFGLRQLSGVNQQTGVASFRVADIGHAWRARKPDMGVGAAGLQVCSHAAPRLKQRLRGLGASGAFGHAESAAHSCRTEHPGERELHHWHGRAGTFSSHP